MMSIYRLPYGQYSYSGHVINLPQDISSFVNSLPRHPNNLDIIAVRKQGSSQSHHFHVRRSVVLRALQFLIANNIYFRNISINNENLALLPEDGNIFDEHIVRVESEFVDTPAESEGPVSQEDHCRDYLEHVFHVIFNLLQKKKILGNHYKKTDLLLQLSCGQLEDKTLLTNLAQKATFLCFSSIVSTRCCRLLSTTLNHSNNRKLL